MVPIKDVPDLSNISISRSQGRIFENNPPILKPADENAIEAALSLKDKSETQITVIHIGKNDKILRQALAMGADSAFIVNPEGLNDKDPYALAVILRLAIEKIGPFDKIICGGSSITGNSGQTGRRLAQELLTLRDSVKIKVDIAEEGCNSPRTPNAVNLMKAFKKEIEVLKIDASKSDISGAENIRNNINRTYLKEQ